MKKDKDCVITSETLDKLLPDSGMKKFCAHLCHAPMILKGANYCACTKTILCNKL